MAGHRFSPTRWTLVVAAGAASSPESDAALAELCEDYWAPLRGFIQARGYSREDAEDLTQAFFERLIARRDLAAVDPARGRFRSFLLAAVTHFLSNARDHEQAAKRGGRHRHVPLEEGRSRGHFPEPVGSVNPEAVFDRQWLATLIRHVVARLEAETDESKHPLVRLLVAPLTDLDGDEDDSIGAREVAAAIGMSEGAARVALHRLRRRFAELLRQHVAQTVADPADIEEEIRYLFVIASGRP